jgi:hypothetical protein
MHGTPCNMKATARAVVTVRSAMFAIAIKK